MLKVGSKIKDVEDSDCYFVGVVTELNQFKGVKTYKVTQVIWDDKEWLDDEYIGQTIEPKWWYIQLYNSAI
jgi:hypothetical protein